MTAAGGRSPTATTAGAAGRAGDRAVGRLARQPRPAWIAAGIALVALAVLGNVYLFQNASHRSAVVRVVNDVPVGARIRRADLGLASVVLDPGVASISQTQLPQVVGRIAAVDLRRGTLLSASQVTTALSPQPGQAVVTMSLKAGEMPPHGLAPGFKVRLVQTSRTDVPAKSTADDAAAGDASDAGQDVLAAGKDVPAVVDSVGGSDADGTVAVSLLVADADSSAVARAAAGERLALVITARGG
jgi:hypothetical protein